MLRTLEQTVIRFWSNLPFVVVKRQSSVFVTAVADLILAL